MSFIDYIFLAVYIVIFILMLILITWRITCFFKKSCRWKACPYRHNYHYSKKIGWTEKGCKKFPPTQEEIDAQDKMLDKLDELIEHLKQDHRPPIQ